MHWRALLITVTVLSLTNCDSQTPVDIFDINGRVTGTVYSASGTPIAGAVVTGSAAYPLYSGPMEIADSTETASDGSYALQFTTLNLPDAEAPVAIQVTPPVTSGLLGSDTSGLSVRLARSAPTPTQADFALLPYQPNPEHLLGEFSGRAGTNFAAYDLFLAVDEVTDSVRGLWSLSFRSTCATHDGQFSGTLEGNQLRLRLRPDQTSDPTLDVNAWLLPGDTLLAGNMALVQLGTDALCFTTFEPFTLLSGDVPGLPIGR
jgi:hypothetical protein